MTARLPEGGIPTPDWMNLKIIIACAGLGARVSWKKIDRTISIRYNFSVRWIGLTIVCGDFLVKVLIT